MAVQLCPEFIVMTSVRSLGEGDAGPNLTLKLVTAGHERLPPSLASLHSTDLDRALYHLATSATRALTNKTRLHNEPAVIDQLQELEGLSQRLASLLDNLDPEVEFFELQLQWSASFSEATDRLNPKDTSLLRRNGQLSILRLQHQLEALGAAAEKIRLTRKGRRKASRPADATLAELADASVLCWCCLSLLAGSTVANCFPTGSNRGLRWCAEFILAAVDIMNLAHGTSWGWGEASIQNKLSRARKDLVAYLLDDKNPEPESQWSILGFDSVTGFSLICMAMEIDSREELLLTISSAPLYFALYPDEEDGGDDLPF